MPSFKLQILAANEIAINLSTIIKQKQFKQSPKYLAWLVTFLLQL